LARPDPGPSLSSPRTAPSIHLRAALTWLAIFPLVAIGTTAMAPFTVGWDPVLRAFVLPRRWCVERTFSWINRAGAPCATTNGCPNTTPR
jgi:transposase